MPGSGTRTFLDPDRYEAGLRQAQLDVFIISGGGFKARFTWAELHNLQLLRSEEDLSRIAYVALPPQLVFVSFPTGSSPLPVWRGTELQTGEVMFHSRGERLHQWTSGPSVWNLIAMNPAKLEHYARALNGSSLALPTEGRVLRPSLRDAARLRRLHAQACRLAETRSKTLVHLRRFDRPLGDFCTSSG